jgi:Xaa-Pro aminopeptidase
LLVSRLESFGVPPVEGVEVLPYGETEDGVALLAEALHQSVPIKCAISDAAWASTLLKLQEVFRDSTFVLASPLLRVLRMRKSPREIELIRQAGLRADRAFEELVRLRFSGRTEREIGSELGDILRNTGLASTSWGPIVASGPNGASPHHLTGERVIREGDAVVLDFGGALEGYQADISRTVHVGSPSDEFTRTYEVVKAAQQAGVDAVRPGLAAESVDRETRSVIEKAGYGEYFVHRTGHGLGLEAHEEPYIVAGNPLMLEASMVFSIEPGVYLPGEFGVRIEDIVAVTSQGAERMNNATRDLQIVR